MSDTILTVDDIIAAGGCGPGIRTWFENRIDDVPVWYKSPGKGIAENTRMSPVRIAVRRFSKFGMPVEIARSFNDGLVNRAIAIKEATDGR